MGPSQPDPRTAGGPADGIVLAAGRSRRMGRTKALLPAAGGPFVERAVRALRDGGCHAVVVVVNEEGAEVAGIAERLGARVVVNPAAGPEQIESLRLALDALPAEAAAAVVLPVDAPLVRATTVAAVLEAFRARHAAVVRAAYRGEPGHPTLFARRLFAELRAEPLARGARSVIEAHATEVEDVPVDDPGVVADIDTPEDYRRHVGSP